MKRSMVLLCSCVLVVSLLCAGCAFHTQSSMGIGGETKYAASMSEGRGVAIDYGPDPGYTVNVEEKRDSKAVRETYTGTSQPRSARD